MRTAEEVGVSFGVMRCTSGVTTAPYGGGTCSSRKTRMPEAHASVSTVLPARRLAECSVVDRAIGSEAAAVGPLAVRRMATLKAYLAWVRGREVPKKIY